MEEYDIYTLPNGIRVVHKQVTHTKIAHCGFTLDIGSRDEKPHQQGIAHFWEHMAFKGTKKRKSFHILNRLEAVGGELNAFTTKEKISFHASVLDNHYEKAFELLTDITFDSIFPEKQIERERNVILEEMAMYYDSPEDSIQDEFDAIVFENHSLGFNILGTTESVRSFHRDDFKKFIAENLNTSRVIFSSIGNIPFSKIKKLADKYLAPIPTYTSQRQREPFLHFTPQQITKTRAVTQAQCALGRTSYPINHSNRLPFYMLVNILGGPGMNSRLNLALREKHGFVYSVEASYSPFLETGLMAIYFGTEPKQLQKSLSLISKELKLLRDKKMGTLQFHTAKEQLMGQLAMSEESNLNFMLMMAKSLLDTERIDSLPEIFSQIRTISAEQLQDLANEMLNENEWSKLLYLPEED
ncbi:pitrilysin family protein [Cytophagaceae bacterium DM2B3-1]|uniref:Pitrilysin family protein n=1 Tax=Xanthocytophaga flava TaxID=3048013 RepID=A0ABT7CQB0_9BACT|nr:pitrilysin family protein [Xanthocytophaga flavus]MDJ1468039.1 pitrilysin family protein [Xanthocytophaga flavus]MDJ1495934.1 pitrilysin family protein [Xanthocytophaga flavus]